MSRSTICRAVRDGGLTSVAEVKAHTRAGTGCGGGIPLVASLVQAELAQAGRAATSVLCEHFAYTRQELFEIVKLGRIPSFEHLLASHGTGAGCEVCRPAVASILASTWNDFVLAHASIQDTNDGFLANIQRGGTYSVIPRIPGGEITPEKLILLGEVAQRFDVLACINLVLATGRIGRPGCGYASITGQGNGQGAREHGQRCNQLPGARDVDDPAHRAAIAAARNVDEARIPRKGTTAPEIVEKIQRGEIRPYHLGGSLYRIAMETRRDHIGPRQTGLVGITVTFVPLLLGWLIVDSAGIRLLQATSGDFA